MDWHKLRKDRSDTDTFEELCCQLARYEAHPPDAVFIRKAPPDAGVECFWALSNGEEWGWQTKYFLLSPTSGQWQQIDESIEKAIEKHPKLSRYIVCLPINRSDSRREGQKSFLDYWNEHVKKWNLLNEKISFEFWGDSEIEERLSREEHNGRYKFFFDKEFLTPQWFDSHLQSAISNAGMRYTPELNVELPLAKIFQTLGRTVEFYDRMKKVIPKINKQYKYASSTKAITENNSKFQELDPIIQNINKILKNADEFEQTKIPFEKFHQYLDNAIKISNDIISTLEEKARKNRSTQSDPHSKVEDYDSELYHMWELLKIFRKLTYWTESDSCNVANTRAMLLKGDAGTGKTHLFCDVANHRIQLKLPTVVLFGSHFLKGNPMVQILQELDLTCTFKEFLVALETAAQISNSKAMIMIDALNEGEGQHIWSKYLAELLTLVAEHPWVCLAVSVRTSYEQLIIPKEIDSDRLSRFTHTGFGELTEKATKIFFESMNIERPSVPLLVPEFSNPQFLLILCRGLQERKLTKIPKGLKGLTAVYDFFIDAINDKLSQPDFLDYEPTTKIVQKGISLLSEYMSTNNVRYLKYEDADKYLNNIHSSTSKSKSLLYNLISEGLLSKEMISMESGLESTIQFSYERLGDNLIIKNHLMNIENNDIRSLFLNGGKLAKCFEDQFSCMRYRGLIEALSIQIPEKFEKEIIEIDSRFAEYSVVLESFLDSLMWRNPQSIRQSTLVLIEHSIFKKREYLDRFLKVILTISSDPEILVNAEYLHNFLMNLELGKRDYLWSIFLHHNFYNDDSIVNRCIEWGWHSSKSHIQNESIYLSSLTLSWFLTSSNRFIRDKATKALVSLLTQHLDILRGILKKFTGCNDPYVLERLFAVAYGCAMRNGIPEQIKDLALDVYSLIFEKGEPPPDIQLRDYAKGVIDLASALGIKLEIKYENTIPPYNSKLIEQFPSKEEIEELEKKVEGTPRYDNGGWTIFYSLGSMGDFNRYILGTNSRSFEWTKIPLLPERKSRIKYFNEFTKSITPEQKTAWENYDIIHEKIEYFRNIEKSQRKDVFGFEFDDGEFEQVVENTKEELRKSLTPEQKEIFEKYVVQYVEEIRSEFRQDFNLSLFERWIIKKVFDLGWEKEKFGRFDQLIAEYWSGRESRKAERMGKKYQWIAYNELLARVSDNFEMKGNYGLQEYLGTWQLSGGRDLDPSLLMSKTFANDGYDEPYQNCWWFPISYNAWDSFENDIDWLKNTSDLPSFKNIIEVKRATDESSWLVLGGSYRLQQQTPADQERYEIPRRDIWVHLCSYLVQRSKIDEIYEWCKNQGYRGVRMPEYDSTYDTYLGELYWSPSVQRAVYHGEPFWTKHGESSFHELPTEVYVPIYGYQGEIGGYDCSIDEHVELLLPNRLLAEKMKLTNKVNGIFTDERNEVTAFTPTVIESGPMVLLINKEKFTKFLNENDYEVIWTFIGQKSILGDHFSGYDNWKGELQIYGTYRLIQNRLEGFVKPEFVDRALADKINEERSSGKQI